MDNQNFESGKAWWIAFLLFAFMALNFIDKIVIGMLAVPLMEELHLKAGQFGLVASSFFWLFSISGILGGFISNRVSTTIMLLVMALAWSLCQIPMALASGVGVLVVSRVLLGIAEGPAFPVAVHACYKWFPDKKRNLPVAFIAQGGMTGLLISGLTIPLISARWGWHANFYVLSIAGIIWTAFWLMFGREGNIGTTQSSSASDVAKVPYPTLFKNPTVIGCMILHFVAYWSLALTLTWLPAYLQKGLGYSGIEAGRFYSAMIVLSIPIMIGISYASQRMMQRGVSSRIARGLLSGAVLVVSGLALLAIWLFELPPLCRVAVLGAALATSPVIYSLGPAMLAEVTPSLQRGSILSIDNSIASIAGIIAPLLSALFIHDLTNAAGYEAGFALCGALMVIGGLAGGSMANPQQGLTSRHRTKTAEAT
ncbi:MFS transporter [Paraburkholderia sp. BCC1884]|uniref:MFS transporter n=1 Tax=Paraburkholderia sp. BCC1884 TaxID=2562668 RepID=UPI0021B197AC|nr:MFS transporter [Paraburkholderia sp. BCC1884]